MLEDTLHKVLQSIRDAHSKDASSGDDEAIRNEKLSLEEAMNTKGTLQERKLRGFLRCIGIRYDDLSDEGRFVFTGVLGKSKTLRRPKDGRAKGKLRKYK